MRTANKERVALLVAALRSGEYQQVSGALGKEIQNFSEGESRETRVGFCCLGVACEVAIKNGLEIDRELRYEGMQVNGDELSEFYYNSERSFLPIAVMEWYGFNGRDPVIVDNHRDDDYEPRHEETAASLNDQYHWEFPAIADAFERFFIKDQQEQQ